MTALSDALAVAQARAVAALAKQYVGGTLDVEAVSAALEAVGLTDSVDKARWLAALDVIREGGGEAPAETQPVRNDRDTKQASKAQLDLIRTMCEERKVVQPDTPLTWDQAHEIIDSLKAGTYNPDKWKLPF